MSDQPISKFMLTTKGLINLGFGLSLVVAPVQLVHLYGETPDEFTALLARLFGAGLLEIGAIQFFARNAPRGTLKSLLVGAVAVFDLVGLGLAAPGMLAGQMTAMGWADAGIYAFAGFGFAIAWLRECRTTTLASPKVERLSA